MSDSARPDAAAAEPEAAGLRPLGARIPRGGTGDPDEILDLFLGWVADKGFELYPAQEEALLEVMAGRHVILATPTGSGKSLVAQGLHFKALCERRASFYTSPIKALASEKFFSLCDDFGAENVGMLTGDASINPDGLLVCCTAEVLANMALRRGPELDAPYVVMDEFHYYADRERGVAWQIPLISLPATQFLLMSATLGDTSTIAEHLRRRTGRDVAYVSSDERPVPLDFEYRETPLTETVGDLLASGRAPIYIVNFTQRDAADRAQGLTSMPLTTREERDAIREAVGDFRFDTPYGKEFRRFLSFGVGVHHAGLLPKYRLLVEQLSQQGRLKVISGTDTLGVGVNIPIRTVLFSKLSKYDGQKVGILSVRDFKQIAGRAGRRGFDVRGSVVAQAPEHIIEKKQIEAKADGAKKRKALAKKKGPAKGEVVWSEETFRALIARPPETLQSSFKVTHGMVLALVQRDADLDDPESRNFTSLRRLIAGCHEDPATQRRLVSHAALLVRSLHRAGILRLRRDSATPYLWVVVDEDLQFDFSLHQALSLYLVDTLERLDRGSPGYAVDLLSLVESILEDPRVVLLKQVDRAKGDLVARLKAEGVPYEERMERLEEVTHPKPLAEFIYQTFNEFRRRHPWVAGENIRPKGIGREMFEGYLSFADFVRRYGLARSEGVLLRYLSQLYKTLDQTVPDTAKSDEVHAIAGFLRAVIEMTDTSLLEEWESLLHPEIELGRKPPGEQEELLEELRLKEFLGDPKAFATRVRAEMHLLVKALAEGDWEEAAEAVRQPPEDSAGSDEAWPPERFEEALAPYLEAYGELLFTPEARHSQHTRIRPVGMRRWEVSQVLLDPVGDHLWHVAGEIDLTAPRDLEGPLVRLRRIGP